ncbi:26S proteasome non-ATPase regulatory subunit 12 [Phytophthora cinnamomi]|uniref:26S proteasome non-ATPase regulatory subunit 12 n=1 Tax=Phytophthora cinnamomi TaxID=4785 RepID=UPI00355960B5|nr:26S proteasome non-ATPase regulatory subunit 12 [Phytophthora cinnamomi]
MGKTPCSSSTHLQPPSAAPVVEDPATASSSTTSVSSRALRPHPSAPSGQHDRTLGGPDEQYLDAGERRIHLCQIDRPAKLVSFHRPLSPERAAFQLRIFLQLLRLVEPRAHLVNKENMIHKILSSLAGTARVPVCNEQHCTGKHCPAKF